mmetsp:Transcript_59620/g.158641  ORF Transcript_59620/g.158641 Transcript_59620/m.158641 type:complete len:91 (-) Transcript_59620:1688-1960(-)
METHLERSSWLLLQRQLADPALRQACHPCYWPLVSWVATGPVIVLAIVTVTVAGSVRETAGAGPVAGHSLRRRGLHALRALWRTPSLRWS